jgi:TDG/mug DNA glycosylase family protein
VRRAELEKFRGGEVDDLVGTGTKLLWVGINPGLWTAAVNAHFARPGNRFWPALQRSGLLDRLIDASAGFAPEDLELLRSRGMGITNLVNVATARADELSSEQLREGVDRLRTLVRRYQPIVVAVLGLTAYRSAFQAPKAAAGEQPDRFEGAELWVAPNPSGLNAHETADSLAVAYRRIGEAAGILD